MTEQYVAAEPAKTEADKRQIPAPLKRILRASGYLAVGGTFAALAHKGPLKEAFFDLSPTFKNSAAHLGVGIVGGAAGVAAVGPEASAIKKLTAAAAGGTVANAAVEAGQAWLDPEERHLFDANHIEDTGWDEIYALGAAVVTSAFMYNWRKLTRQEI